MAGVSRAGSGRSFLQVGCAETQWLRAAGCVLATVDTVQVKEVHKGEYPNFFLSLLLVVS